MSLSRQHYRALADVISAARENEWQMGADGKNYKIVNITLETVTSLLITYLQQDNPRFDRQKFREACEASLRLHPVQELPTLQVSA